MLKDCRHTHTMNSISVFGSPRGDNHAGGWAQMASSDVVKAQARVQAQHASSRPGPSAKSSKPNFSYPRPESRAARHEPSDSRSSVQSNGSVPGMTDASDSEASVDDDFHYNASASELWDSFWPEDAAKKQTIHRTQSAAHLNTETPDYFSIPNSTDGYYEPEDDTITLTPEKEYHQTGTVEWPLPCHRSAPLRPQPTRAPATADPVYPRPADDVPHRPAPIPPRTSSLTPEPFGPLRRRSLKSSKSSAQLHSTKSSSGLHPLYEAPVAAASNATIRHQAVRSVPVSPLYPAVPGRLRPTASAYNMREQQAPPTSAPSPTQHNATAPLAPLSGPVELDQRPVRPEPQRFVSVFECDSDNESDAENGKFVKRLARGLQQHKKSASGDKRNSGERKAHHHHHSQSRSLGGGEEPRGHGARDDSQGRKRGGSLGRMLGLKGR